MYDTDDEQRPFAGREALLEKVHTQLMNSPQEPLVILGRWQIGKTAFLHHFAMTEAHYHLAVFIALKELAIDDEAHFWVIISQALIDAMTDKGIRLSGVPMAEENARRWFAEAFLPSLFRTIRQRHVVLLFDDAHSLIEAMQAGTLPTDLFEILRGLCMAQLQMLFSFALPYEDMLGQFMPFIGTKHQVRLSNLDEHATATLIQTYGANLSVQDLQTIYHETAGVPCVIHHFGKALQETAPAPFSLTACTNRAYLYCEAYFSSIWQSLSMDERLILTAIADLFYDDPLRPVTLATLAGWSVNSDYLLDETAISATIRGLVYAELVLLKSGQIVIHGGLFRRWLLENARLWLKALPEKKGQVSVAMMMFVGMVMVIGVLIVLLLLATPPSTDVANGIPTLTLSP